MVWLIRFAFLVKSNVRIREVGSELILGEEGEGAGLVGGSGERRFGRVLFGLPYVLVPASWDQPESLGQGSRQFQFTSWHGEV